MIKYAKLIVLFICLTVFIADAAVTVQYTLTVSATGEGTGTLISAPKGIKCSSCSKTFNKNRRVTLRAKPAIDAKFAGWGGACSAYGTRTTCVLKLDEDKNVTAQFDAVPRYAITVTQGGGGTGTVIGIPRGIDKTINCGPDCSATYLFRDPAKPTKVTLIARAAADSIFVGWSGQCTGTDPCVVAANENKTVRAAFISRASTQLEANSLSITSALPGSLLTVNGSGFDLRSSFFVRFTGGGPFSFDIPAVDVRPSSVTAIVPPFIDANTGQFIPGNVNIHVVQKSDDSTVVSAPVSGFQIGDLPAPLALPGVVTLSLLKANVDIAGLEQNNIPGTLFDTDAVFSALLTQVNNFSVLSSNVEQLLQDSSRTFNIGSINGNDIAITSSDLISTDRLIMGVMLALASNQAAASPYGGTLKAEAQSSGGCAATEAKAFVQKAMEPNADLATLGPLAQEVYKAHSQDIACKSADAFDGSYKIIGGAGSMGMGLMTLAGAPGAALALPSAALLYVTTEGAGGLIGLGGTRGQVTPGASEMVQNGISIVKDTMQDTVLSAPLSGTAGNLYDITVGAHSLRQAVISAPPHGKGLSYKLSVSKNGAGNVMVNPDMFFYAPGTVVALEAVPGNGFAFAGWSGACSGKGVCTLVMTSNKAVNANFNPVSTGSISGTWTGSWIVTSPDECNGISGTWAAVFTDNKGALSGAWESTDGSSGSLSGAHYGDTVTWSVGGGSSGVFFSGTLSGITMSGDFSSSLKCLDKGTLSGGFSGSRL